MVQNVLLLQLFLFLLHQMLYSFLHFENAISLRFGYHGTDGDLIEDGFGGHLEFRFAIGDTPFDIVLRGHAAYGEQDDDEMFVVAADQYLYGRGIVTDGVLMENAEDTIYGGSVQVQYNFLRGEAVNPYISAGVLFEKDELEYDGLYVLAYETAYVRYLDGVKWHDKIDEDGFAFVGRLGVEFKADPMYARFEAGLVTKVYDGDNAQAELNAVVGTHVTEGMRLEVAGTYYTDWEEYYIMGGLTFLF